MAHISSLSAMSLIVNKMVGTGIFLTPSIILQYCQGNVGLYLSLWVIGSLVIACGILIYLEFALHLPIKNGGEKNYLQRIFDKRLIGFVYAFQIVLLGFSSGNSYAFGKYILYSINGDLGNESSLNNFYVKAIGVLCISYCTYLHIFHHHQSNIFFIFLGVSKILILLLIIVCGALVFVGAIDLPQTHNFSHMFVSDSPPNYYSISVALLEIIYSFKGWENVNYVLSETRDPYKVLTRSAPLAVLITTVLYFLVILSYLVVIPKQEIMSSGVLIAGIFFNKIFGQNITSRVLPLLIAVSNFGNVLVVSYAHSVVNKELSIENLLPFSKTFTRFSNALLLHWLVTVVVLVLPPSAEIYEFIVNLYIYPGTWINILLTGGLLYLRYFDPTWSAEHSEFDHLLAPKTTRRISTPVILILVFLAANLFMALFPFLQPPNYTSQIPYWCFPVLGTGSLVLGAIYYLFTERIRW
ncbi:methionine permease [Yamadazyma tenuis ATCC 10573]|uniref:Methionine permease n=1 Tax=Candida tenuis (strain ATCC 10573 / BCRC 21748 / CBS 615 / JCM 9827 / NBRC 10315 / NRRL Y-1498 / VKM Y-70) TaxID=590646 RepID=G3B7I6_CANTC|nr:methionine permease [Yamadazyma tenuis ATCC 10573]EGV61624.1 methionine permease [Yamadazyma tenuis ATCC 10573]